MAVHQFLPNVVVAARHFNPTVMGQIWLVKNQLVAEGDFEPGCVFSDELVQVRTKNFGILLVPQQLQFFPECDPDEEQSLIIEKVAAIVETLPHTPYIAVGLNFFWSVVPESTDIATLSRKLFYNPANPLYGRYDTEDALFGAYLTKNIFGCRLKTEIKPIAVDIEGRKEQRLHFAFNFHRDVLGHDDSVSEIVETLRRWDEAKAEARSLMRTAGVGDQGQRI